MVDIETLSLETDALVLQVGVCVFDSQKIHFMANFNLNREEQSDRRIDYSTVMWWVNQSLEAKEAVLVAQDSVFISVSDLWAILEDRAKAVEGVWANSPTFDLAILKNLFGGKTPWSFRQERDYRTVVKMLDPDGFKKPPPDSLKHMAMADAVWQAQYLMNLGVVHV
jgi:hypothetical protein